MYRKITICLVTLLFAVSTAEAGPRVMADAEGIASVQLSRTTFEASPEISFEYAVVRISGPEGYELTKRLGPGETLFADIALERDASTEGGSEAFQPMAGGLPEGRYGYEIVLGLEDGSVRTQAGSFRVEGGSIVRPEVRSGPSEPAQVEAASSYAFSVDNNLTVNDTADDGETFLQLNSGSSLDAELWLWKNTDGLLRLQHVQIPTTTDILSVEPSGQVGIGTTTPSQELHIDSPDGGDIRLTRNGGAGSNWFFGITGGDDRIGIQDHSSGISPSILSIQQGAPPTSLEITSNGNIGIGTASPAAKLHVNGSFRADGDVTLFSSRAVKTAIGAVNPADLLAKVAELTVATWRYKSEDATSRHIGPFAEDFQRLFGVGDGETISVIDAQGVTLAAIQGLQQELAENDAQMQALQSENADLRSRLTALEAAIEARIDESERESR
ncbi:MAG: hypothetical protein DWQ36_06350 [Acidobacteria bacterium]|nr:MAG: hypothetical protein DWQ30_19355 [Acidobacteriota bacterium]REK09666.1 MAG: hypothetical protein DWQ36_06350 [Acidobacteriota bacterium]